ncbi:G-protein coupled receptor 4-like [Astyanax mexicanus]|uniref:G-protein coupled receptor 4-like n=1 Tax=Astyanax mexicanus TaxID=7994 RepID=A0A8T2L7I1_ASTMX|nr:G-protein coupled receptor 4-like [Astyanax mexicanus]
MEVNISSGPWRFQSVNFSTYKLITDILAVDLMITWALFFIELPVVLLAMSGLYVMTRSDCLVPVFVINLLVSDLIQIFSRPFINRVQLETQRLIVFWIYNMGLIASIGFMVCISFERYVMITFPLQYRSFRSLKFSVCVSVMIWSLSLADIVISLVMIIRGNLEVVFLMSSVLLFVPYPLVVFCFFGSWRALSRSVSVPPDEKKRVLRILALVLFSYTVMFLPVSVCHILISVSLENFAKVAPLKLVAGLLIYLNPLADCLMYVFLRKDIKGILKYFCYKIPNRNRDQTLDEATDGRDAENNQT